MLQIDSVHSVYVYSHIQQQIAIVCNKSSFFPAHLYRSVKWVLIRSLRSVIISLTTPHFAKRGPRMPARITAYLDLNVHFDNSNLPGEYIYIYICIDYY